MQHQALGQPRQEGSYEYQQSYMQPAVAPAPPSYHGYQTNNLPPIQTYYEPSYEPMGAPILPPLRIHDQVAFTDDYQRRLQQEQQTVVAREQERQAAKDEKATGGVSAKLDYEMERMTDFVTEATQTMYALHLSAQCVADVDVTRSFHHGMQSLPSFRKWVHQVLSATRLPSATILLSLHYLNERVAHFPETVSSGENQIYRLLAVAMILGSKFLDDNTFVNRSWSDVTAIKVKELNTLEAQWLQLLGWHLHVDPEATNGLKAWLNAWEDYDQKSAAKQQQARLSPLDTNVQRHHPTHRERYSPYPTPYSSASSRGYEAPQSARSSHFASTPYSSVDPWSTTDRQVFDDFYKRQHRYPSLTEIDDINRRATEQERARQSAYAYQQSTQPTLPTYYQPQSYGSAWDQQSWNAAHRYDCACSTCIYQAHYRSYPMPSSYSAQTVMG